MRLVKALQTMVLAGGVLAVGGARAQEAPGSPAVRDRDFVLDVLPWLQVSGCSAAKCHGGSGGRGGLQLSLFGSDPRADHRALTAFEAGRRIDYVAPERSLLLRKPTRDVPHRGGKRFAVGDPAWRALRDWIADGARYRTVVAPRVTRLMAETDAQSPHERLLAFAELRYPDGFTVLEELGARVTWSSSSPSIVSVDADGRLHRHAPGVAAIFARFGSQSARVHEVVVPHSAQAVLPAPDTAHGLDRAHRAELARLGLAPAPERAPDWLLLRRLTLDLAGRLPRPDELDAFAEAEREGRVERVAERLLASEDFRIVQSERLADLLDIARPAAVRDGPLRLAAERGRRAIRDHLAAGEGLSDLVRRLVVVGGPWLRSADARDRAERTAQGLLGLRIGCARCHDHPLDSWRQQDHLSFAALFTDPRPPAGNVPGARPGILFDARGLPVERRLLRIGDGDAAADRNLDVLDGIGIVRDFLTDDPAARRQLARHFANHTLSWLFGRGPVHPVDDHRPTNPARLAGVLDAATEALLRRDLDLRALLRWIVGSELYQRRALEAADPAHAADLWIARPSRELPPWLARRAAHVALLGNVDESARLPAAPASPLTDQLDSLHGAAFLTAIRTPGNALELLLALHDPARPEAMLEDVFELLLSRPPTSAERSAAARTLQAAEDSTLGLRQVAFALCNTRGFRFCR